MTKNNVSLENHFMSFVLLPENPNDCWIWKGAKNDDGYGQFRIENKICGTHRVSYALFVGNIPDNLFVCHSCDNPSCVNPSHLFLGTYQDNINDRNFKDRQAKGEKHGRPNKSLTEQNVHQIRGMIEQGHTQQEIADMFGVSNQTISLIKTSKNWGWLK